MSQTLQIILPIAIVELILVVVALVDIARSERTNGPKWIWAIVAIGFTVLGPVAYFLFGRRRES